MFVITKESDELHHSILSFPLPFQGSTDSNGPDNLYRSSDLGEPHLSGSLCCDEAQILSKSQAHTAIITYQQCIFMYTCMHTAIVASWSFFKSVTQTCKVSYSSKGQLFSHIEHPSRRMNKGLYNGRMDS